MTINDRFATIFGLFSDSDFWDTFNSIKFKGSQSDILNMMMILGDIGTVTLKSSSQVQDFKFQLSSRVQVHWQVKLKPIACEDMSRNVLGLPLEREMPPAYP